MGLRERLMGHPSREDIARALRAGATVLDIRSDEEYREGHVPGALHIPLGELLKRLPSIPKDQPVVTCNAADAQSGTAAEILEAHGFIALDGGAWTSIARALGTEGDQAAK